MPLLAPKAKSASKYAFAPPKDQVQVHEQVTTDKHKDKTANALCRGLVWLEYVELKDLPGVCMRVYGLRFGSGGLSIRDFTRLGRDERVAGSNFDNLSASAEFAAATPAVRIDDAVKGFLLAGRAYHEMSRAQTFTGLVNPQGVVNLSILGKLYP
ncbi:hypothetical protein PHMEG_00012380 [Phytophthora megakarya]|uniref:Uncharacterized protein n=1 Tax=Phytophthora megakarya TaxID=4795 RepID=A0A225WAZ4_9STRA|nr:hypothetical protein PHMEG_00012380 [Phytophthora megakarya]